MPENGAPFDRIETGVPGLDRVLRGGLQKSCIYIVEGPPGAGKTILANQICYHQASQGAQAVYLTLLGESHTRMIANLRGLTFFRADLVSKHVHYLGGFKVLEFDGLGGLLRVTRDAVTSKKASVLILDGLGSAVEAAPTPREYKKFIHELQTLAAMTACTIILLASTDIPLQERGDHTMVDGIIELTDEVSKLRPLRHLQITKMRGTNAVRGRHTLSITEKGISVRPRIEAQLLRLPESQLTDVAKERVAFGVEELDRMLCGGLPAFSTTMLIGPSGTGKTLLALQFLAAGAKSGDNVMFFGFYERPDVLLRKCGRLGIDIEEAQRRGLVQFAWEPSGEASMDVLGERLIRMINEHQPSRLVIDGMQGFQQAVDFPERLRAVLPAIMDELEAQRVTTLYTVEAAQLFEPFIQVPITGISGIAHNIIVMRHVELGAALRKSISILKVRDSDYDPAIRECRITSAGIMVEDTFRAASDVFVGTAHPSAFRPGLQVPPYGTPARAGPAAEPQVKPLILIVDDEFGLAELISDILGENGYETSIAINGQLGLAILRERRPDLVLMDLMMPVLSGPEMLKEMKRDPAVADIPVVIMTALPEAIPRERELAHQAVLQKPFTPDRLFEVVRGILG
jgi:circadian clock protein KaiC